MSSLPGSESYRFGFDAVPDCLAAHPITEARERDGTRGAMVCFAEFQVQVQGQSVVNESRRPADPEEPSVRSDIKTRRSHCSVAVFGSRYRESASRASEVSYGGRRNRTPHGSRNYQIPHFGKLGSLPIGLWIACSGLDLRGGTYAVCES